MAETAESKSVLGQMGTVFSGLTTVQKLVAAALVVIVLGGLLSLVFIKPSADYKVLFSGLSQEDAAQVVTRLKEQNIPYRLENNGTAILVPAGQVYETRLTLAGEGLPRGGGVGFEIFDTTSLGTTDFVNRLNYQRALQGELARTIRQFQQVQEARVHIATPKESVFIEDEKPVTASVSVKLRGREKLSSLQIQSIVNLVACAVPGLTPENITLVDTSGRLLYRKQGDGDPVLSGTQLEYQFKLEETLRRKIERMLEEVVGANRVRASVTADIDFSKVDVTEENYDPEAQAVRSEQMLSEQQGGGAVNPQGIPGAKGELATFAGAEEGAAGQGFNRRNVTRNYEISKQVRHVRDGGADIRRLSVAVMVDGTYEKVVDKDGTTRLEYKPRSAEEMRYFDRLVKNAIGYNEERGDQVEVASMAFALSAMQEPPPDKLEKWREIAGWVAMPLVYLLIAAGVLLFVIRPFFRILAAKQVETRRTAEMMEAGVPSGAPVQEEEDLTLAPKGLTDKERIYRLAQSDPDRAADLVRRWLREES